MRQQLTANQRLVYHFLVSFHSEEDRLPSTREMQSKFGWYSQTAAMFHLKSLAKKGWLEYRSNEIKKDKGWFRFSRD